MVKRQKKNNKKSLQVKVLEQIAIMRLMLLKQKSLIRIL